MTKKFLVVAMVLCAFATSYAGGYRVSLQGQRALAMGHSGVAYVNTAELAFFNPAGLVFLENKLNVAAGANAVFSDVAWQNSDFGQMSSTEDNVGTPFYLYGSYAINEWFTAGLAVYTPYGSTVEWPTDWAGSHLVNKIELQAIFVQPLVSFKISDKFSVGGGPIFVTGAVNFNRNANRTITDIDGNRSNVTVDDSGVTNFGWSLAGMAKITEDLTLGAHYRSEIILKSEDGTATFSNFPNSPLAPANGTTGFTAELPLPAELTVGASYGLEDNWTFNFDYVRTFWSVYENLDIDFTNPSYPDSFNPRNYKDSSTYRFGAEYVANEMFTLRAGYYFDQSPVQAGYFAPETPRNDSSGYTAGLSFNINEHLSIDASFLYLRFKEIDASYDYYQENGQNVPFEGTYKSTSFIPGLGLSYSL
ncbi:MAG: transporter [Cytophagaceae bacterium]|nr:transporter [Cytophagaceae bacterium]|tara:strand:- start:1825 stop:3081 length:1257 start_codon:yes stop_codon:yes gene_type:complete